MSTVAAGIFAFLSKLEGSVARGDSEGTPLQPHTSEISQRRS
uniref:Uncharacterized protein n=1 Tax=Arundo donax TaxID=35708 RepID=A0A0A9FF48_ARUDO